MENILKENPTKTALLVFYTLLQILNAFDLLGGAWSFFSSTPVFQWLAERWPSMTAELYWWLKSIIHLCMFVMLGEILRQQYKKTHKHVPQTTPFTTIDPVPIPAALPRPSPIIPPTSPKVTFTLTSPQTTTLITTTRNLDKIICIKIVSLPEHLPFARDLETALRAAGCQFMIDPVRNTTIFRARSVHENNRVVLRYRKSDTDSWLDLAHFFLAKTLDAIIIPQLGLASLFTSSLVDLFPPETSADYFQIELGGAP